MHLHDMESPFLERDSALAAGRSGPHAGADAQARASQAHAGDGPDPGPLRILLAEDDAVSQLVAKGLMEWLGHAVAVAGNGREALEMLARERFDLVVMDVRMPELDGATATRIIRNQPPPGVDPRVPIVALTAFASVEDRARIMTSGMDEFLTKPVHPDELRAAIERLCRKGPRTQPPADSR